jgi:hypothetical protein
MEPVRRIATIERLYSDQWVVVEVTRVSRTHGPLAGRVLAHAPGEDEITREAVKAARLRPSAQLFTFYTGALIPKGVIVAFGRL